MISKCLQSKKLKDLHATYFGLMKLEELSRLYCTSKFIDEDVQKLVKSCQKFSSEKHSPTKAFFHH